MNHKPNNEVVSQGSNIVSTISSKRLFSAATGNNNNIVVSDEAVPDPGTTETVGHKKEKESAKSGYFNETTAFSNKGSQKVVSTSETLARRGGQSQTVI